MTTNTNMRRPRSLRSQGASGERDRIKAGAMLGLSVAMLMPSHALAQAQAQSPSPSQSQSQTSDQGTLATIKVEDTAIDPNPNAQTGVPYKARTSGDDRHSRPLAETPATITVLTRAQIDESGYTDLVRILDAQPGVTVGTGENGNAFGDRYIIRGQEARSDVFVDGLRDPGMTTRESFAIEQLEISKGPDSSFAGRGTSGGAINAITKQPTTDYDFGKASIGGGSDRYIRTTADLNYSIGTGFAVRANLLYAYQNIPDRAPADRERKGVAVSALYSPVDALSINLDYYGLRAHDNPDLGGYLDATTREPVAVPVYAQDSDFQDSNVNTGTAKIKYAFSPGVRITNITRYGDSNNDYVVTGSHAGTTVASGPGGAYPTITFTAHQGWQDVEYLANQTNLYIDADILGAKHQFIIGGEYTDHKVLNGNYIVTNTGAFNCRTSGTGAANNYCGIGADGRPVNGINTLLGRIDTRSLFDQDWKVKTISGYVMDTFDITSAATVFAGVRADHYKFALALRTGASCVTAACKDEQTFWNGHVGLTYKVGDGMFYASAASAADINGGESDVGTNSGYGGLVIYSGQVAGGRPERSWNYEIGTKWNVLHEKLLLTAALFQTDKKDVFEGADYTAAGTFNTGGNRVRGFEIGVAGNVTEAWSVQGGLTVMDSKVTKSFTPANVGKTLANFAKVQAQFQSRYQFTDKFAMGAAIKYKSARYGGQPDTAAPFTTNADGTFFYTRPVPGYAVGDLFAEYKISQNADLRINVNNITDKDYYLAVYRGGFFLYKGDARQIVGTLNLSF